MVLFTAALIAFLFSVFLFLISALPLYFAVKLLGGQTSLLKTALVSFISGIIVSSIKYSFKFWGGLLAFIMLIWIYHEIFRLKWIKAFLAWLLQFVFIAIFYAILIFIAAFVGISLFI